MFNKLVKMANDLDRLGCSEEADILDNILVQAAEMGYGESTIEMVSKLSPEEVLKALEWTSGGDKTYVQHLVRWAIFQKKMPKGWNFESAPRPSGWKNSGSSKAEKPMAEHTMSGLLGEDGNSSPVLVMDEAGRIDPPYPEERAQHGSYPDVAFDRDYGPDLPPLEEDPPTPASPVSLKNLKLENLDEGEKTGLKTGT